MRAKLGDGVMACGNATKDAEFKRLGEKNTPNAKWGMAVGKDADDNTVFVNCEAWGRLANYAANIKKGDPVLVFGQMRSHEYNDKTYHTLVADFVQFIGSATERKQEMQQAEPENGFFPDMDSEDLPF
jgi:single-stranded DNA-binding protein